MAATLPALEPLYKRSAKRTWDVFAADADAGLKDDDDRCVRDYCSLSCHANGYISARLRVAVKLRDDYANYRELPAALLSQQGPVGPAQPKDARKMITAGRTSLVFPQ
jgi:pleiotropic regulator 1